MSVEKCLFCGADIPEGRQVCPLCEKAATAEKPKKEKKKMLVYIFPVALIVLDVGAAIANLAAKDYRKAIYWLAAAVLNICVTF